MNFRGIKSLMDIFRKNAEMQLPSTTGYRVLASIVVLGIMIPCVAIVGIISYVMTEALIEVNNPGGAMLLEMHIMSAFSMIFGIMVIFSVLFFAADRDHLITLPIPAHHLLIAKFFYAYFAESIMEFMVLLAVFVGYSAAVYRNISAWAAINPVSIISALLGTFMVPLIPMIYCALFSLVLMSALKNIKNERIFYRMSTVFMLFFAGLFLYSLRGIGDIKIDNYVESLGSGENLFMRTLNVIFFPVVWLSEAVSQGSVKYLLLYLISNVLLLLLLFYVGKALYQGGLYAAASLGSSKKARISSKDLSFDSPFIACVKKEFKTLLRTRAFSANTVFINLIWPLATWLLFHMTYNKGNMFAFISMYKNTNPATHMMVSTIMISLAFIATALNCLASTAFTREGAHLSLVKYIPVKFSTQMYAKAYISFLFTYPALLITDIIICVYLDATVIRCIAYAVVMFFAHVISVFVGMYMDSLSPYVTWDDEYSALRGNLNAFFNMAVMMIASLILIMVSLVAYHIFIIPSVAYYLLMFVALGGVFVRLMYIMPKLIVKNMEKMS